MNIAFVPVRGGSKGIHLKNVRNVCGVPLLQHSLYTLERSPEIDLIVVSTDSYEVRECANAFGSSKIMIYWRRPETATDEASTESAMEDFFTTHLFHNNDQIFLIQVTNPFLREEHILKATELMPYYDVVSVTRDHRFLWNNEGQPLNYAPSERPRRQDWDGIFIENGALYATTVSKFHKSKCRISGHIAPLVMEGKHTQIEIDDMDDLIVAEALLRREGQRLAKVVERARY